MDNYPELQESFAPDFSPVVDPAGEAPVSITLLNYSPDQVTERLDVTPEECQTYLTDDTFTWVHVQGQPRPRLLMEFGKLFDLHPLALEDVINIGERSKTETFENQIVVILGMPVKRGTRIISEQVTFFLGKTFLISFHNGEEDPFRAVRRRLHHPQAALRTHKIDYLLYALVDVIIDHGFPILDEFDDEIEQVEQQLLGPEGVDTFKTLYIIKRELLVLRLKIRPQREALRVLMRDDNHMLNEETVIYLRDCYDHVSRLIDMIEIYRDMTSNMLDVHLSLVNKKTLLSNEVQRKATVWAMLFAPLTFITGIYGMNFVHIPELNWNYGFLIAIISMAGLGVILAILFKKRNWL